MIKFGIQLPHEPLELIIRAAAFADQSNIDSVFTPDHIVGIGIRNFSCYEAFTLLGKLASITRRVQLGTCVSDVLRRHPATLLQSAVTLHEISNDRAVLGVGAGEGMNTLPYGIEMKQAVSKLEEALRLMRLLMESERVTFSGKYFRAENAFISPRKIVPLWIAGNSPRTIRLAAQYGDGWIPTATIGVAGYRENLREIKRIAGKNIIPALFAYAVIAEKSEDAEKRIELPGKFIALLSPRRDEFLRDIGLEVDFPDILGFEFNEMNVRKVLSAAEKVPFEAVQDRYIYGSPDDVIERLEKFISAGVRHFVIAPLVQERYYMENIRLLSERVIPFLKERE